MQRENTVLVEHVDKVELLSRWFLQQANHMYYVQIRMGERHKVHTVSANSVIRT
jgi:hypothetical protein